MSAGITIAAKAEPILPGEVRADRPLFIVLAILVFLACLSAIAAHAGFRAAGGWNSDLASRATVQVLSGGEDTQRAVADLALTIEGVEQADMISRDDAIILLRPWLGPAAVPEDLPVPLLVELTLSGDDPRALDVLGRALTESGADAQIDDHQRWSREIRRAASAVQLVGAIGLFLLIAATGAAAGFATQSGMAARHAIIDVLRQVGAGPGYIARLFIIRFGKLGALAGVAGAGMAMIVSLLFWLMSGRGSNALMPSFAPDTGDFLILLLAPVFTAAICALAAGLTAKLRIERGDAL